MILAEVLSLRQKRFVDLMLVVKTTEAPRQHAGTTIRNYTVMDDSGFSAELAERAYETGRGFVFAAETLCGFDACGQGICDACGMLVVKVCWKRCV